MLVVVLLLLAWLFDSWDIILFRNLALLIIVILAIFDFVRSRIYKKKITPTMDFIISCCFLTNRYSGIDGYEIGAVGKNLRNRFRMRRALRGPWGIKNKRDSIIPLSGFRKRDITRNACSRYSSFMRIRKD